MDDDFGGNDADFLAALHAAERTTTPSRPPTTSTTSASRAPPTPSTTTTTTTKPKVTQPTPQPLPHRSAPSSILVSPRQKGNPILSSIRSLAWEYSDIPSDYLLSPTTACLFLSLKYHRLHPEYIYTRIRSLSHQYSLRLLLTLVDIPNHDEPLRELSKTSLINDLTLVLCWSAAEAARYLELFKTFEHASPAGIRAQQKTGFSERVVDFITVPRSVNKADAVGLMSHFGSLKRAIAARPEEVGMIAGWGEKKVERWCGAVREPFRVRKAARRGEVAEWRERRREEGRIMDREEAHADAADAEAEAETETERLGIGRGDADRRTEHRTAEDVLGDGAGAGLNAESVNARTEDREDGHREEGATLAAAATADGEEAIDRSGETSTARDEPADGMSEGMLAALARLREQG